MMMGHEQLLDSSMKFGKFMKYFLNFIVVMLGLMLGSCGINGTQSSHSPIWTSQTINATLRRSEGTALVADETAVYAWSREYKNSQEVSNTNSHIVKISSTDGGIVAKSEVKAGASTSHQPMILYQNRLYTYNYVLDTSNPQALKAQAYLWVLDQELKTLSYTPIDDASLVMYGAFAQIGSTLYLAGSATNSLGQNRSGYVIAFDISSQSPIKKWTYFTYSESSSPDYAAAGIENLVADEDGVVVSMYNTQVLDFQNIIALDNAGKKIWGVNLKDSPLPVGYTPETSQLVPVYLGLSKNTVIASSMSQVLTGINRKTGVFEFGKLAPCGGIASNHVTYDDVVYFSMAMGRCILAMDGTGKILFGKDLTQHFTFGGDLAVYDGVIYASNTYLYGFDALTGEVVGYSAQSYPETVPDVVVSNGKIISGTQQLRAFAPFRK
jgi:hypothetical protein